MKKLSVIQDARDHCLAQLTSQERLLPQVLGKAAKRRNLSLPQLDIQRLATAILNAQGDAIQLDLDPPCSFGETEEEIQATVRELLDELEESIADVGDDITEAISQAVPDALAKVAELVGDQISEQAHEHTLLLRKAYSDRAEMVQRMWGAAIEQLDFLRHIELQLLEVDRASGTAEAIKNPRNRYVRDLRMQKTAIVKKFGPAFANDYGWASVELGCAKTKFRDLESHVGLETLRRGYQQANSTIHGGALATLPTLASTRPCWISPAR